MFYYLAMNLKKIILASLLIQSPFQLASARPIDDVVNNYTGKLVQTKIVDIKSATELQRRKTDVCLLDDMAISQIENGLFRDVQNSIEKQSYADLQILNFNQIGGANAPDKKMQRQIGGISEYAWSSKKEGTLKTHLEKFSGINYVELKVVDYMINPDNRTAGQDFSQTVVKVKLDIRGKDKNQHLIQDRLVLAVNVKKNADWTIEHVEVLKGLTLVQNLEPAFEDVTSSTGLDKVAVNLRTEAIRRGGYALAVTDYNDDGIPDIFVGHRDNAEMFLGSKDGTFKKIATPLDKEKFSKTAIFADFNNTGKRDAVINRFLTTDAYGNKISNAVLPLQVAYYKNIDGNLVEQPNKFGDPSIYKKPMPAAVADFNGDGLTDIYIGYPGVQDFSQFGEPTKSLEKFQGLYLNDGKGGFKDSSQQLNFENGKTEFDSRLFPHSSLAIDLNQDQKMDLVVLDDRGNLSPAFVNQGGGMFKESAEKIGISNYGYAMGISSGDINNDGLVDIGITNVNFNEMARMNSACNKHRGLEVFSSDDGVRLFTQLKGKNGKFAELAKDSFGDAGEGMGGLTFLDYNNDGLVDIYVVNGLWSGTKAGQNMGSFFSSAIRVSKSLSLYSLNERNDLRFMDVLQSFKGKIGDYTNMKSVIESKVRPSLAGFQRNRLFRNNGDGTFTDVAYLEGVDSIADGYIVGKMDYNHDGLIDLVLRNADPGTEDNQFPAVQLFKNKSKNSEKSVVLTFEGTRLTREGLGLFVKAYAKGWQQVAHLEGNSGSMQQQHFIHFGLGQHKKLDRIEVYWPSGIKQIVKNLGPGYHHIVEPHGQQIGQNK